MSKNFIHNNDRINGSNGGHSNSERMSIGKFVNGNNRVIIRHERQDEQRQVESLVRESFWNVYRPGCLEHYVLNQLRQDEAFVPELNFVMELEGRLIGQVIFMRAEIKADDGRSIPIMTMGPICIAPEYKRQGYGSFPKLKIPHQSHADFCSTDTAGGLDNKKRRYAPRGGVAYRLFLWGFPKGATPPFGTRLCEAKCSVLYALPALP